MKPSRFLFSFFFFFTFGHSLRQPSGEKKQYGECRMCLLSSLCSLFALPTEGQYVFINLKPAVSWCQRYFFMERDSVLAWMLVNVCRHLSSLFTSHCRYFEPRDQPHFGDHICFYFKVLNYRLPYLIMFSWCKLPNQRQSCHFRSCLCSLNSLSFWTVLYPIFFSFHERIILVQNDEDNYKCLMHLAWSVSFLIFQSQILVSKGCFCALLLIPRFILTSLLRSVPATEPSGWLSTGTQCSKQQTSDGREGGREGRLRARELDIDAH